MSAPAPTLGDTLIDADTIRDRIVELASDIDLHYAGIAQPLLVICVLKGALMFASDLVRILRVPLVIDFVRVGSYGIGTESSGKVELLRDVSTPVWRRDVLVVEDIVDTGNTLAMLRDHLGEGAASLRVVTLLDKPSRRTREVGVDWRGFTIPDTFVVGFGLDHRERYRELPDLHELSGV